MLLVRLEVGPATGSMVHVLIQKGRHKDGGVKEVSQRGFPRIARSRSRRTLRMVSSTTFAGSGASLCSTHIPCFLYMRALPRAGRKTIWSSELSSSNESPGLICRASEEH